MNNWLKYLTLCILTLFISFSFTTSFVYAQSTIISDVQVDSTQNTSGLDETGLGAVGNVFPACDPTVRSFFEIDLTTAPGAIPSTAVLQLIAVSGSTGSGDIAVYGFSGNANDGWDETAMTNATAPAMSAGTRLGAETFTGTGTINLGSNGDYLGAFLEAERTGDGVATIGIQMENCTFGAAVFNDKEDGLETGDASAILLTSPTAVTLSDTATNTTSYVWVALAALLIAGTTIIVFGRRKQEEVA